MSDQIFNGPVGQVAGGNIHGHSRWDQLPIEQLLKFKNEYSRDKTKAVLSEYFNRYSAVMLVVLVLFGWWGWYMLKTGSLTGDISPQQLAIFAAFVVGIVVPGFWLARLRHDASATIAEIDDELKKINQAIRFKKSKR